MLASPQQIYEELRRLPGSVSGFADVFDEAQIGPANHHARTAFGGLIGLVLIVSMRVCCASTQALRLHGHNIRSC